MGADLWQVRAVIAQVLEAGAATARLDGKRHDIFPVAVHPREAEALRAWVQRENAMCTVEVGLGYGVSALFICEGLLMNGHPDAHHVALDPNQATHFSDLALQLIDEAGLADMVEFLPERSELALPRFVSEGRRFDLAFIDGNHRFEGVFLDLMYLGRLVRGGGILFLDDYQLPATAKAVRFCTADLGWSLEEEGIADAFHHWAVVRTPRAPLERDFTHFVDF